MKLNCSCHAKEIELVANEKSVPKKLAAGTKMYDQREQLMGS